MMKNFFDELMKVLPIYAIFTFLTLFLAGCDIIGGIFKAGVWVGVIIVVLIIVIIFYIMGRFRR